uniref:Uncharacterized protein n=1 Tax=Cacopsylla melanoneura TaxID=428564 RepID=A0A8D8Y966_9HEMI
MKMDIEVIEVMENIDLIDTALNTDISTFTFSQHTNTNNNSFFPIDIFMTFLLSTTKMHFETEHNVLKKKTRTHNNPTCSRYIKLYTWLHKTTFLTHYKHTYIQNKKKGKKW